MTNRPPSPLVQKARASVFAIGDQGFFSLGSFIFNILLARVLLAEDYGVFVVCFTLFHIVGGVHNALVVEPMLVFGVGPLQPARKPYLLRLFWVHVLISPIIIVLALLAVPATGIAYAKLWIWALISAPFIFMSYTVRKSCYLDANSALACLGSLIYFLIGLGGMVGIVYLGTLEAHHYFQVHALAGLGVAVVLGPKVVRQQPPTENHTLVGTRALVSRHWQFGRWSSGAWLVAASNNAVYVPLLGHFAGLAQVAYYRSAENLLLPLNQAVTAISTLILPKFARAASGQGPRELKALVHTYALILGGSMFVGILGLTLLADAISHWIYDGRYTNLGPWIASLGILYFLRSFRDPGYENGLRAVARNDRIFFAVVACALVSVTIGVWLVMHWELVGAVIARCIIAFLQTVLIIWGFYRILNTLNEQV